MCPVCHAENQEGGPSCARCGARLALLCRGCGAPVPAGAELCQNCHTEPVPMLELPPDALISGEAVEFEPQQGQRLEAPLLGRSDELQRLQALAQQACQQGELRFALVIGAPGSGKTRLMQELARHVGQRMPERSDRSPSSQRMMRALHGDAGVGTQPLGPMAEMLAERFGIEPGDASPSARDKLMRGCRALLAGVRATEVAHLLGEVLRVPFPESPVTGPLNGQGPAQGPLHSPGLAGSGRGVGQRGGRRAEPRLYLAVKRLLQSDASRAPLCLLFDEMEHTSPEMMQLLQYLAAGLTGAPVLVCVFARPELDEAYPDLVEGLVEALGESRCVRLDLQHLKAQDAGALLCELTAAAGPPPPAVLRHVEQVLEGTPRAIVELVRFLVQHRVVRLGARQGRAGWDQAALAGLSLPRDMEGLVAARLATMEPATRGVLERAAASGERFFYGAVVALLRRDEVARSDPDADPDGPTLEEIVVGGDRATGQATEALRDLERWGVVRALEQSSIRGEREYSFAYPPWRDVIYEWTQPAQRRSHHRMLAQWLELTPDGLGEDLQEVVGKHLERAGQGDAAARRYRLAADLSRQRAVHGRATRLYLRALACHGTDDLATRLHLWRDLGEVFHQRGDYDNALAAYEKVVRLAWVLASRGQAAAALMRTGQIWQQKSELKLSLDYLEQSLGLFRQAGDAAGVADAQDDIGKLLWLQGRLAEALDHAAAALEARRKQGDRMKVARSLLNIGHIERHRGLFDVAEACYREALEIYRSQEDKAAGKPADRLGVAACLNGFGMLLYQRGEQAAARRTWEEALVLAEEEGATPLQAVLLCHLGECLMLHGAGAGVLREAEARFQQAQDLGRELSDRRLVSESLRNLGLVALGQGDRDEALLRCERALELAEQAGIRLDMGRALLSLGEVYAATLYDAASSGQSPAREYFERGVALLREIGNAAELGHGLFRLGRYYIEEGEMEKGPVLLREAEGIFSQLQMRAGDEVRRMLSDL